MDYAEIYFSVASVATIAVAGLVVLALMYVLSILHDIKRISKTAKKEVQTIAKGLEEGAEILGSELSRETAGFVKTVFALLLSQFAGERPKRSRKAKIQNT